MLLDEVDTYAEEFKTEGSTVKVFSDRCSAYWDWRKILGGGTPKIKGASNIDMLYARGDERV